MKISWIAAVIISSVISAKANSAYAGPIVDEAAKAEKLAEEGKDREAIFAMDTAIAKLWDKVGLTIIEATFTEGKPASFGKYDIHPTASYKSGDDMFVYAEAIGYKFSDVGEEFKLSMTADLEIRDADDKVLATKKGFTSLSYQSRVPNREFMITITYNFSGLPEGEYTVTTKLNDDNFDHWASFDLPFKIE